MCGALLGVRVRVPSYWGGRKGVGVRRGGCVRECAIVRVCVGYEGIYI